MSTSRSRTSRVFTVSFPEDLAKQVDRVAKEESRNISELFREAFRTYRRKSLHEKLEKARAAANARASQSYREEDVEAIVNEIRSEMTQRRKQSA